MSYCFRISNLPTKNRGHSFFSNKLYATNNYANVYKIAGCLNEISYKYIYLKK